MTTTFKQLITDETFIGTSYPVSFHHSLSYFGPNGPDAEKTTLELSHKLFDHYVDTHVGHSYKIRLTADITAGIALPSWAADITVEEGEVTSDNMKLTITNNTVMGGMLVGAELTFNFIIQDRSWHPGSAYWRGWRHGWGWHSGHWNNWKTSKTTIKFDLIPMGIDFIVKLAGLIPKLKTLLAVIPSGMLDNMQDYEQNAIVNKDGVFISANMPMKWELVSFSRTLAECGIEVAGLASTVGDAAIATIVELGEFLIKLIGKLKVFSFAFGPQLTLIFPLRIKITKLVASSDDAEYEYDSLTFSGNTITGTNNSTNKIPADASNLNRIGIHCQQSIDLPTINLGIWSHISLFVVFSGHPSKDFRMLELLEKELGIDQDLADFNSSMSNTIGGNGDVGTTGGVPDSVKVNFI